MAKNRLLFIDNLRTVMVVLVILAHLSITYGGEGSWFYKERPVDMLTITALSFFNAVTQSYFMGVLTFVVRLWLPINWALGRFNLQLPFFVQYIAMLIIGVIAYRRDWLMRLPKQAGRAWLAFAGLLIFIVFPILFTSGGALQGDVAKFRGGLHWQAFAYATWEQVTGVAMIVGLTVLFRERLNRQGALAKETAASSYTVYIIHAPVVILLTLAVRDIQIYPLLKFVLAAATTVPLCFLLAAGIRRLPLARNVL